MITSIDKIRARIEQEYIDKDTELVDNFLYELRNPKTVEIVEALEYNGYSHFRVMDTIIFNNIDLVKDCETIEQFIYYYLEDEGFITDTMPTEWIDTEAVYNDLLELGNKILPNPKGGFVFIR